jgi:hypothetical protein
MSLYDLAMGDGRQADRGALFLTCLGNPVVARYRDSWAEKGEDGEPVIAIYTRQGGGNRECYCEELKREHVPGQCYAACNEALAAHPLYLRDADDDFDATYATFWFRCPAEPPELRGVLAGIMTEPVSMSDRWQEAIDRIGSGEMRPAEVALGDQLGAFLSDPSPDGPRVMEV